MVGVSPVRSSKNRVGKHIVNDRDFLSKSELNSCVFSKKIEK